MKQISGALLDRLREDTPGVGYRVHLNNAGASLVPRPVRDVAVEHLDLEARVGGYEAADLVRDQVNAAYEALGALLGTRARNIAVMENATAAFVGALSSILFEPGDRILTTRHDYVSNQIQYLSLSRRFGIEVVRAPDGPHGGVDVAEMEVLARRLRPRLVAVSHVPTNSGLVQDVEGVGAVCGELDIPYLVDACQSVGQMPLDVGAVGCDFLSGTARKFLRGPRGVGFLYVSDRMLERGAEPLFPDLRGAEWVEQDLYRPAASARRFENWEFSYALLLGMGEAARYALELGLGPIRDRAWALAARLRDGLGGVSGVRVLDEGAELSAIVTLGVKGWRPRDLVLALRERGVNTSALDRSAGLIDFDSRGVDGALRVSPHYYNTEEELWAFGDQLLSLVS